MSDPAPPKPAPPDKLSGAFLMAVGALIAVLCGLCSFNVIRKVGWANPEAVMFLVAALICGGIPIAVGGGIFLLGRRLYRGARKADGTK